jgi:hypothetical protein
VCAHTEKVGNRFKNTDMARIITDGTRCTPAIIAKYMNFDYLRFCSENGGLLSKSRFYCGITNDIDANYSRHKNDEFSGKDFEYVSIYMCASAANAASVESILQEDGFDCGNSATPGNGGTDDSIYVYMFKKP